MKEGRIYLITNEINLKRYVGQTVRTVVKRFEQHKIMARGGSKLALHCAMRKYGEQHFTVKEVVNCEVDLLNELERIFIGFYGTLAETGHGYNMNSGGEGRGRDWSPSEETRRKVSESMKGKTRTPEHRAKLSMSRIGKKFSDETRKKLSDSHKGQRRPQSEETKRKIGQLAAERFQLNPAAWNRARNTNGSFRSETIQ